MKIHLLITVLSLSLSLTSYALGLNDLSILIPRIETTTQSITQSSFDLSHFWGALTPAPLEDLEFNRLIDDSMFFKKTTSEVDVKKAVRSFFSFENPK